MTEWAPGRDIVLAIDLNHPESWDAMPDAALIARAKHATLHLAVVVPDFGMSMVSQHFPPDFERKALEKAREELRAMAEAQLPDDIPSTVHVVLASHAPERMRHVLLASQAERIACRSPVSVLVVRN